MTSKEFALKEKLRKVKDKEYVLDEGENYFNSALEMLELIGSLDSELRDRLIYSTLCTWIINDRFTSSELEKMLDISLGSSHLFNKLYEKDEDAVFKRTFSALMIAVIVYKHRQNNFLIEEKLFEVKDKLVEYMLNEKDVRGYVDVKGWAHSAAHTADALDEIVQCPCFKSSDLLEVLNSIKAKASIGYYSYVDEEEERMVNAVESAISRKILTDSEIIDWLQGFIFEYKEDHYINIYHSKVNRRRFLRSMYLRLVDKEDSKGICEELKKVIGKI